MKQKRHSNGVIAYRIDIEIINCFQIYKESLRLSINHVNLISSWIVKGAHWKVFLVGFEDMGHHQVIFDALVYHVIDEMIVL